MDTDYTIIETAWGDKDAVIHIKRDYEAAEGGADG